MRATNLRKWLYRSLEDIQEDREPVEIVLGGKTVAILMPSPVLDPRRRKPLIDLDAVAAFCRRHRVKSFSLFGSILRDDFGEESDVDVIVDLAGRLVDFHQECRMVEELEAIFGRKVDMLTADHLANPRMHPLRREAIITSAKVIYEQESYHEAS